MEGHSEQQNIFSIDLSVNEDGDEYEAKQEPEFSMIEVPGKGPG